jgi:hypothetical protein
MSFSIPKVVTESAILNFCISLGILFTLMLGSGVLPVPLPLLALIALAISIIISTLSFIAKNWKRRWPAFVALGALTFLLTNLVFLKLIDGGLRRAKSYTKSLALEIETLRNVKGVWPANLKEIPADRIPQVSFSEQWPYAYEEDDGFYDKVGGFLIDYYVENQEPKLAVGRRDINVDWNWKESRWEKPQGRVEKE